MTILATGMKVFAGFENTIMAFVVIIFVKQITESK